MADKKGILYNEAAKAYFYGDCVSSIEPYGGGHINDTFLARTEKGNFVLQRVNGYVFPHPDEIMDNMVHVTKFLAEKVLLEIVARGDPILDIEFAAGVIDLEMLPVRRDVHPAGEAVKPDQRVHIETARHGFVLDHLAHEADIPVELEPLPEKPGRGAQVEVMAHQAVRTRDSPLGRIYESCYT